MRQIAPARLATSGGEDPTDDTAERARDHDPVPSLLEGLAAPDGLSDALPCAIVMELLLDRWLDGSAG